MSTLQSRIQALSAAFADSIIAALRETSISELTSAAGVGGGGRGKHVHSISENIEETPTPRAAKAKKTGRLARRSEEDIAKVVEEILVVVKKHPEGIRAEELREELGLDKKEMPKPMLVALANGSLRKEGEKRATVYYIGGKASKAAPKKKSAAKKASPKAKASSKKAALKKAAPKKKPVAKAKPKAKAAPKKKPAAKAKASKKTSDAKLNGTPNSIDGNTVATAAEA